MSILLLQMVCCWCQRNGHDQKGALWGKWSINVLFCFIWSLYAAYYNWNNTSEVLWKFVNRERGSLNNTLTCSMHLQVENDTLSSTSRICNIFNFTFFETANKLLLDIILMHSQTSNNNNKPKRLICSIRTVSVHQLEKASSQPC
jgi:hypothetical protein